MDLKKAECCEKDKPDINPDFQGFMGYEETTAHTEDTEKH